MRMFVKGQVLETKMTGGLRLIGIVVKRTQKTVTITTRLGKYCRYKIYNNGATEFVYPAGRGRGFGAPFFKA